MYREFKIERATAGKQCPVCHAACFEDFDHTGTIMVICPKCGQFRFGSMAQLFLSDQRIEFSVRRYKLSHFLRSISERAFGRRDNSLFPIYEVKDFEERLESSDPSVREKLLMLLRYIANLSAHPGHTVGLDPANDYPVLCAKNRVEADFYVQALENEEMISVQRTLSGDPNCTITSRGWQEFEKAEQAGVDSPNGFIAMWFDSSQNIAKEKIEQAVSNAGYRPIRIDQLEHVNRIDDEIIAQIRRSKFLVADLTGHRNGVYFEAGFMLGLGRPVIWVCNKSAHNETHFDARQYNTIVYEDIDDLKSRLQFRIEALLGRGPIKS